MTADMTTADAQSDLIRQINSGQRLGFDTERHLAHATQQAKDRKYSDFLIVDTDAHHYENYSMRDIAKYIEDPILRHRMGGSDKYGKGSSLMIEYNQNQSVAGRIHRYPNMAKEELVPGVPRDVTLIRRQMRGMGIDIQIQFPTPMLHLGMHPDTNVETALSWAYTRWFVEEVLPHDPAIKTLVFLPFNDPDASLKAIREFGDKPGVVGFMVTGARYRPVHDNAYMKVYAEIEERNMPLAFHASAYPHERVLEGMNKFLSVHALGFVLYNMVHLTNMVINGIPERFPNLKVIWMESGLAWVPFMMQRLDNEYMMRTSEAPLLKMKPSEYMRRNFYYTSQPIEAGDKAALECTMRMINAETQLLFSSDYPHWDFDLPSSIYDLPFLDENQKRRILGENARELFNLPTLEELRSAPGAAPD
ncbi:amidohydrolase family protein [Mycobacterium sp. NAZ190054]|uniref:amidohydrolase family protein n=1 Tax=Mycobacterium sp. NAZ190054 TaxID=1747766 RepID=UPI000AC71A6E|nr:amidohydrolase family protein [Mycobacterium sp. NAZ190054]